MGAGLNHPKWAGVLFAALVAACDNPAAPASTAPATPVMPADVALASLYTQACKNCHGNPGSGAPQAGDRAAWEPRVAQGMATMLQHTINGYKGMPPLGSCPDCTEADFKVLIGFMSGAAP